MNVVKSPDATMVERLARKWKNAEPVEHLGKRMWSDREVARWWLKAIAEEAEHDKDREPGPGFERLV